MSSTAPVDARGRFGRFGGRYVPETLIAALDQLERAYQEARADPAFQRELDALLADFVGRPTPLYRARRLEAEAGGPPVYLKREDLNHTGAHKINNTLGQALLARRMGKRRIIAETGAGQHGVATATACALFDLECVVYMGEEDAERQALNVYRMELLGAEVRPVGSGTRTLKDATNEAIRDWVTNVLGTHYIIGSVVGPDPFPRIVRDFQSVIGIEARAQMLDVVGRLPAAVLACVGGGSNAMGVFHAFVPDEGVELVGVEAAGRRARQRSAFGVSRGRNSGCAARRAELSSSGCGWAGGAGPLGLGRARLSRCGSGALLAQGHGTGPLRFRRRWRGARSLSSTLPPRGDHIGA